MNYLHCFKKSDERLRLGTFFNLPQDSRTFRLRFFKLLAYDLTLNLKIKVVYFVLAVGKRTGLESRRQIKKKFSLREEHILDMFTRLHPNESYMDLTLQNVFCLKEITIELMFSKFIFHLSF